MSVMSNTPVLFGTWTVLAESEDTVRATVTHERDGYVVRNSRGTLVGRYSTAQQALASLASAA